MARLIPIKFPSAPTQRNGTEANPSTTTAFLPSTQLTAEPTSNSPPEESQLGRGPASLRARCLAQVDSVLDGLALLCGATEYVNEQRQTLLELRKNLAEIKTRFLDPKISFGSENIRIQQVMNELERFTAKINDRLPKETNPEVMTAFLLALDGPQKAKELLKKLAELRRDSMEVMAAETRMEFVRTRDEFEEFKRTVTSGRMSATLRAHLSRHCIPPMPNTFHGRQDVVDRIVYLLCLEQACRIPILGTGGIGKTTVAAAVLHHERVQRKFGQNIVFIDCEVLLSAEDIVLALAFLFGIPFDAAVQSRVLSRLEQSEGHSQLSLLVLDNLETTVDAVKGDELARLLGHFGALRHLSLIITMRRAFPPSINHVRWENIAPLNPLSSDVARQIWRDMEAKEDHNLDKLLHKLGGLPLAITLMASQGRLMSPTELLKAYDAESTKFVQLEHGDRRDLSLDVSIRLSIDAVLRTQPKVLQILPTLALMPGGASTNCLGDMWPFMQRDIHTVRSALVQTAVAYEQEGRLRLLPPVRDYICSYFEPEERAVDALLNYYDHLLPEEALRTPTENLPVIVSEWDNIDSLLLHRWSRSLPSTKGSIAEGVAALFELTKRTARFAFIIGSNSAHVLQAASDGLLKLGAKASLAECRLLVNLELLFRSRRWRQRLLTIVALRRMARGRRIEG